MDEGAIISVLNCHTIDGKGDRKIPATREKFTTAALQGCVEAAVRFRTGLASTQVGAGLATTQAAKIRSFVVMGDFKMKYKDAVTALRIVPQGEGSFACAGDK